MITTSVPRRLGNVHEWSTEEIAVLLRELNVFDEEMIWHESGSPKGRSITKGIDRTIVQLIRRKLWDQLRNGARPSRRDRVRSRYETSFEIRANEYVERFAPGRRRPSYFRINGERIVFANGNVVGLAGAVKLGDIMEELSPASVCEVGSGAGGVLFYLANRLPGISFSGFELTESGVALTNAMKSLPLPETSFGRLHRIQNSAMSAIEATQVRVGSAFALPCPDSRFDLVFTHSALEQMADGLDDALREIRRVARKYVVFCEPFREANDSYGRMYLWTVNYFRTSVRRMSKYGLRPVAFFRSLPVKSTYGTAVFVGAVV